jgi:oligoendopeptidase F
MARRRSLLADPDRAVRRAAFAGGTAAWQQVDHVAAAALNAIAGTRLTLDRRRGLAHFLDVPLFQAAISRPTLEAMWDAVARQTELPRRVLRLRARGMGIPRVGWYDLEAPLPLGEHETLPWDRGRDLVQAAFGRAYPRLAGFFAGMCRDRWIEWEPRPGKRPGAFCTGSLLSRESRVYMTYAGTMADVRTLAHEAGHAFHSATMRDLRPFARLYPMTLAEAASTFAEMLLTDGALADPRLDDVRKARILDLEVAHAAVYLLDIRVRFLFEEALYEERGAGEVSVSRLGELMTSTQRQVFGDLLEADGEDPYLWAWKLHFYITGVSFYNFPYTFGYLLSRGFYARFRREGAPFLAEYEEFLRRTGSAAAEVLARQVLGCDLTTPGFWEEAIATLAVPLERLEALLPGVATA